MKKGQIYRMLYQSAKRHRSFYLMGKKYVLGNHSKDLKLEMCKIQDFLW